MILFHSNDGVNAAGPDRITVRAPQINLQTYNGGISSIGDVAGANDRVIIRPTGVLEVNATESIFANDVYMKSSLNVDGTVTCGGLAFSGGSVLSIDSTNKRIGIATSTPTTTLDVSGNANISGNINIGGSITGYTFIETTSAAGTSTVTFSINPAKFNTNTLYLLFVLWYSPGVSGTAGSASGIITVPNEIAATSGAALSSHFEGRLDFTNTVLGYSNDIAYFVPGDINFTVQNIRFRVIPNRQDGATYIYTAKFRAFM
jgi:hypothetical protein